MMLRIYSRISELTGALYATVYLTCHENLILISLQSYSQKSKGRRDPVSSHITVMRSLFHIVQTLI